MTTQPNHLNWRPGGAQGAEPPKLPEGGDVLLIWLAGTPDPENAVLRVYADYRKSRLEFLHSHFMWGDAEWYIPVSELPVPQEKGTKA